MNLRSGVPSRSSFWVAFCGCSFELTDGERQCWVPRAERPTDTNEGGVREKNEIAGHVETGKEILANQCTPQARSPSGLFIAGGYMSSYNAVKALNHLPRQ
jgi:hypothetical protein